MTNDELRDRVLSLVHASRDGDEAAWSELVDLLSPLVWSVARGFGLPREDAIDVSQTTWLQFARHVGEVREPEKVPGWLATTAKRECQRLVQKQHRERLTTPGDLARVANRSGRQSDDDEQLLSEARRRIVWESIDELDPPCRRLLRMFLADPPPTYDVVAEAFDISVNSVGAKRSRCLACLRKILARHRAAGEVLMEQAE